MKTKTKENQISNTTTDIFHAKTKQKIYIYHSFKLAYSNSYSERIRSFDRYIFEEVSFFLIFCCLCFYSTHINSRYRHMKFSIFCVLSIYSLLGSMSKISKQIIQKNSLFGIEGFFF